MDHIVNILFKCYGHYLRGSEHSLRNAKQQKIS